VLLSARDIKAGLASACEARPLRPELIQLPSIGAGLGRYFQAFENRRYPYASPESDQPELTRLAGTERTLRH
jgi:hypothetical protein